MDYILSSASNQKVVEVATARINALIVNGEKESSVFCFGEDKHVILNNLRTMIRTMSSVLSEQDYRVNHAAYDQVKKHYLQKLSERVGPLSGKTLRNCPALFDVLKVTVACALDGIPAIYLSYYPEPNPNISVCGLYEQPEFTIRVPLIFGSTSIYNETNKNRSAMISFGISVQNLKRARTRMRSIDLPNVNKQPPRPQGAKHVEQPNAQPSGNRSESESEEVLGSIPNNISHETTIVDTLRAGAVSVTHRRRATISLR